MKNPRKIHILVFAAVMAAFAATFSGCSIWGDNFTYKNIDIRYRLLSPAAISDYETINPLTVASTVWSIVMPATVEVNCKFTYSFTVYGMPPQTKDENKTVTAVMLNDDGYLLTSAHAVATESESSLPNFGYVKRDIIVRFLDSDVQFYAMLVAYNLATDLAVLKIDTSSFDTSMLNHITFFKHAASKSGASEDVMLAYGEPAVAIGNGYGFGLCVTTGTIAAPVRYVSDGTTVIAVIQTDIVTNFGFPGAPLCNVWGAVMGLLSAIKVQNGGDIAYAIPSYTIMNYLDSIRNGNAEGRVLQSGLDIKYYYTNERAYKPGSEFSN